MADKDMRMYVEIGSKQTFWVEMFGLPQEVRKKRKKWADEDIRMYSSIDKNMRMYFELTKTYACLIGKKRGSNPVIRYSEHAYVFINSTYMRMYFLPREVFEK